MHIGRSEGFDPMDSASYACAMADAKGGFDDLVVMHMLVALVFSLA